MPNPRPAYPPEVKAEAVRLATAPGNTLTGTVRDLGVSLESLRKWIRQVRSKPGCLTPVISWARCGGATFRRAYPSCPSAVSECAP